MAEGDVVAIGDTVATMEAMKMEMRVPSPVAGRIMIQSAAGSVVGAQDCIAVVP